MIDVVLVLKSKVVSSSSVWVLLRKRLKCMLDEEIVKMIDFEKGGIQENM